MQTISEIINEYKGRIDYLDLEVLIAYSLGKPREFVLIHPEYKIPSRQSAAITKLIQRRLLGEPVAYLLGHKEFYDLDFIVNKHTLVPRPETEIMVEQVLDLLASANKPAGGADGLRNKLRNKTPIIDVGTGSGCIIVSIANSIENDTRYKIQNIGYYGTDISKEALKIATKNAKQNSVDKKIKFIDSDLLSVFIKNEKLKSSVISPPADEAGHHSVVITANLPYLSKEIYSSAPIDVKKYEPKSALYSAKAGLNHYERLLKQLNELVVSCQLSVVSCFFEISPEQKAPITKLVKSFFPKAKIDFIKDLAGKWRICKIEIRN